MDTCTHFFWFVKSKKEHNVKNIIYFMNDKVVRANTDEDERW